jgi:hypothetical protein
MELESIEKVKKESIIRGLYAQKKKHEEKISYWKGVEKEVVSNLRKHTQQLNAIEDKLERLNAREIFVTTHAIERFRERIGPVDASLQYIRGILLTSQVENMIRTLTNGTFPVNENIQIVVEDHKVITVINSEIPKTKKKYSNGKPTRSKRG